MELVQTSVVGLPIETRNSQKLPPQDSNWPKRLQVQLGREDQAKMLVFSLYEFGSK